MTASSIVLTSVAILLLSACRMSPPQELMTQQRESDVTILEDLLPFWEEDLHQIHLRSPATHAEWADELNALCARQEDLCEISVRRSRRRDRANRSFVSTLQKQLQSESFSELSLYSLESSLQFFGRAKKAELQSYAQTLLRDQSCSTLQMKHALATALEDELPDDQVRGQILALYAQNSQCPASKAMALSSYRAAMLHLLNQDCGRALPFLDKVSRATEDHLKPRSLYWAWKCQGESPSQKAKVSAQLPYFSYHRLLIEGLLAQSAPISPFEKDSSQEILRTRVRRDSYRNPLLSNAARLAEKMMANHEPQKARIILEKIRVERVQEVEPEFQVYWGFLLHQAQSGIRKFQILASVVNTYPQFRSRTVKSMLFPTWYFEHVEANTKTLDPWLIQALIRQESAFDPQARSRVGATGLMQLMPSTARRIARLNKSQLKDPASNVQVGIKFLEKLVEKFDGQVHLALAAYNAGPQRVEQWIKRYPTSDQLLFVDTIPYRETREYVAFILRNYHWYRTLNPKREPASAVESDPDSQPTLFY